MKIEKENTKINLTKKKNKKIYIYRSRRKFRKYP